MLYNLYSIQDFVADEFGPIFPCKNDDVALRYYDNLVKSSDNPNDYILFYVGTFDNESGVITPAEKVRVFDAPKDELREV